MSSVAQFSIKDKQLEVVTRMLNFNLQDPKSQWQDVWKVLVYDKYCGDIIALLLKKGELRNQGITLHLLLHSDRQSINDVPAIYFVAPNKDNIRRICEDCRAHLYDSFHLDFVTPIPRPLIEELASSTVQSESSHLISKVYDQYLNFLSLEKDLFAFNSPPQSYIAFNDHTISDEQAEANLETVVESLFSVLITLEVIPIIRAPKGNTAAEFVARRLDTRLHQYLTSRPAFTSSDPFSTSSSSYHIHRPVLIILDRNIDLTVMFHHPWTYQALVHDLLNMRLNRVTFQEHDDAKPTKPITRNYDLDPAIDSFWSANAATPFPSVAAEIKQQIDEYTKTVEQVNKLDLAVGDTDDDKTNLLEHKTKGLGQLVSNIPELQEKKRIIDLHTNVATALMKQIKDREIDAYFSFEEAIITKTFQDKKELINLLTSEGRGTPEDKMRLFLIYFMANKSIPSGELEQLEEALVKAGADIGPLKYLKKTKAFYENLASVNVVSSASSSKLSAWNPLNTILTTTQGYEPFERVTNLFATSVRTLLPKSKDLYVTRVVDALMETKNALSVDDTYIYLDPKVQSRGGNIQRKNTPFREAIVFVVGGGNYVEYQNLLDYAKKQQPNKKIIYGSTELFTPHEFLQQLSELSKK